MKPIILSVICAIFMSACSGKLTVIKRKYNHGFYIALNKKQSTKESDINQKKSSIPMHSENQPEKISVRENTEMNTRPILVNQSGPEELKFKVTNNNRVTASASERVIEVNEPVIKKDLTNKTAPLIVPKKGKKDSNFILLVILCFLWFLNLIAVYIHDGNTITLNFWITLLLDLTYIGGVIFSLLVILDLVDLR
jgi:hypothetical protein